MARTRRIITEAYCYELERVVTIEEAHDEYFRQKPPRTRFTFYCSDPNCRKELMPLIKAVNYARYVWKRSPGFAEISAHPHAEDCKWVTEADGSKKGTKVEKQIEKEKLKFRFGKGKKLLSNFSTSKETLSFHTWGDFDLKKSKSQSGVHVRHTTTTVSSDLQLLVDVFRNLESYPYVSTDIEKDGEVYPLTRLFRSISSLKSWHKWPHIYWSKGGIYNQSTKNRFCIYLDSVHEYDEQRKNTPTRMYLPYEMFEKSKYQILFKSLTQIAKSDNKKRYFYAFGSFKLVEDMTPVGEKGLIFQFIPTSLQELVITE